MDSLNQIPATAPDGESLVRCAEASLAPAEPQRVRRVVVVAGEIDAHVSAGLSPGQEIDAEIRATALQVLSEVEPATLARLDNPIAQEAHVRLALTE